MDQWTEHEERVIPTEQTGGSTRKREINAGRSKQNISTRVTNHDAVDGLLIFKNS